MRETRGLMYLSWLTFKRQATGRKAFIAAILVAMLSLVAVLWARRNDCGAHATVADRNKALEKLTTQIVLPVYASFLLPILAIVYATGALADEREERTIVHLLIRPLSRTGIYFAKAIGIAPLVLASGLGGYAIVCLAAGTAGRMALDAYWLAILLGTLAYASLFLLFGALAPRPVILAVVYAFFVESMLGNTPGTIKRAAVSFYVQCSIYDRASGFGIRPAAELQFSPIGGTTANAALAAMTLAFLAFGAWGFHRKEFRELD